MSARGIITSSAVVSRRRSTLAISTPLVPVEFLRLARQSAARRRPPAPARRSTRAALGSGARRGSNARSRAQPGAAGRSCALPRVGHAQAVQDARLGHLHAARLAGVVVVVAGQVQRAVHHQMRQMVRRAACRRRRLPPHRAEGQDDLARQAGAAVDRSARWSACCARDARAFSRRTVRSVVSTTVAAPPFTARAARAASAAAPGISAAPGRLGNDDRGGRSDPRECGAGSGKGPCCLCLAIGSIPGRLPGRLPRAARGLRADAPRAAARRPRLALLVGIDDARHQRVTHHVALVEPHDADARHALQRVQRVAQAGARCRPAGRSASGRR